ncbi:MAG: 2,3-bisphosphoglycerate-independent phosphoglycerate mutase [Promethearchaeota archaeon]
MTELKLEKLQTFSRRSGPLVLIIMDGVGLGENNEYNAFHLANTSYLDMIQKECPKKKLYIQLKAHGTAVGLPTDDEMGNSEVGHNAFGAGMIPKQRASLAKDAILQKELFKTQKWINFTNYIKRSTNTIHYIGLLSDGYVHSHISHLIGLIQGSKESGIKKVRIHPLLDGRDVPPQSALKYINQVEDVLETINKSGNYDYKIASGGGRMRVTMDRYNSEWDVVRRGWEAHVCGIPEKFPSYKGFFTSAEEAINQAREIDPGISDQYLPSFVIVDQNKNPIGKMQDGDGVIYFNFRGDRAIQISRAFDEGINFKEFEKKCQINVEYYGLMQYDEKERIPKKFFLEPPSIKNPFTEYLCAEGIKQFAIAETHKYGHVTYFFNGNKEGYINPNLEKYIEIKSDPSDTIMSQPKMKAYEVRDALLKALISEDFKFLRVNFANGDMVGHTGSLSAAMIAAETVDECVKDVVEAVESLNGIAVITADHGNLEEMVGQFKTAHTLNPVMFAIVDSCYKGEYIIRDDLAVPGLGNVAATILNLLGYKKPESYMDSLIKFL